MFLLLCDVLINICVWLDQNPLIIFKICMHVSDHPGVCRCIRCCRVTRLALCICRFWGFFREVERGEHGRGHSDSLSLGETASLLLTRLSVGTLPRDRVSLFGVVVRCRSGKQMDFSLIPLISCGLCVPLFVTELYACVNGWFEWTMCLSGLFSGLNGIYDCVNGLLDLTVCLVCMNLTSV